MIYSNLSQSNGAYFNYGEAAHFFYCSVNMRMNSVLLGLVLSAYIVISATTDTSDYTCNEAGYLNYLNAWTPAEKTTSRDSTSAEFKQRLEYFIDSCEKIHEWNLRNKYHMEFTFYADWHADEFDVMTTTQQRYTGFKPNIPSTTPVFNNSNWRHLLPLSNPCDDVFDGEENSLYETIGRPQNCSVSWAFAITDSIEFAIKKMYLETYDQIVDVALSAQELIDCVAKDHGIEGNTCTAVPLVWGFDYVFENGIAYRQFYRHTNVEDSECHLVEDNQKYHIAGYEKPHVYNKLGLFELVLKGPTAVALGLDPDYFQYYRSDAEEGPFFSTAYWRPSVYGVVVEYKQYAVDGEPEFAQWPFFAIESRLRACDSSVFRLPILESTSDGNIAGIAGFAIRPIVNELLSSATEAPTTLPPTEAPTTVAPTTVAPTTVAPTTVAPTTVAPTTVAPTTVAPTTVAPTTVAPTTEAPVAPTTEAPAVPTTEAPVAPTTEAPAVPTTEAPVAPTTEAPAVPTTEAPVAPTTEAPAVPTTEAPAVPTTEAPVMPTTEAPVAPTTEAPAVPTTEAPVVPTTEAPAVPTTEAPAVPTTEAPVMPTSEAPMTEAPVAPTTEAPTVDTTTAAPTTAPSFPPTPEPVPTIEYPTTKVPTEAPVIPTTEAPVAPTTEAPVMPTTEAPVVVPTTEAPAVPTTEAPAVPTTEAPAVMPTTEAPVVPTTEAPAVPTTEAPAVPTEAPVVPTTEAPAVPTTEAPAVVPTTEAPAVPTTEAPAVATSEPTVIPTIFIPPTTEAPAVPTTEPTTQAPAMVTEYADETVYPTLDMIPRNAQLLVFRSDSYSNIIELDLSDFPNLVSVVFESSSFKNAQSVSITSPTLTSVTFGPDTFYGEALDGALTLYTPNLQSVTFESNALHFVRSIHLRALSAPAQFAVYNGALTNVKTIYYMNTYVGYANALAAAISSSGHAELVNIVEEIDAAASA